MLTGKGWGWGTYKNTNADAAQSHFNEFALQDKTWRGVMK
jgi:hypothetical protein